MQTKIFTMTYEIDGDRLVEGFASDAARKTRLYAVMDGLAEKRGIVAGNWGLAKAGGNPHFAWNVCKADSQDQLFLDEFTVDVKAEVKVVVDTILTKVARTHIPDDDFPFASDAERDEYIDCIEDGDKIEYAATLYALVREARGYLALSDAAAGSALDERKHVETTQLQEVADGAWGDGPLTRGAARDELVTMSAPQKVGHSLGETTSTPATAARDNLFGGVAFDPRSVEYQRTLLALVEEVKLNWLRWGDELSISRHIADCVVGRYEIIETKEKLSAICPHVPGFSIDRVTIWEGTDMAEAKKSCQQHFRRVLLSAFVGGQQA